MRWRSDGLFGRLMRKVRIFLKVRPILALHLNLVRDTHLTINQETTQSLFFVTAISSTVLEY